MENIIQIYNNMYVGIKHHHKKSFGRQKFFQDIYKRKVYEVWKTCDSFIRKTSREFETRSVVTAKYLPICYLHQ